jgi:hypothetical protein
MTPALLLSLAYRVLDRKCPDLPLVVLANGRKFNLDAVHAVDAVNEEDEDEDECNLCGEGQCQFHLIGAGVHTFMPYCSFAIMGLSDTKVKSLRRQVNGRGTIRAMKMTISVTNRRKTWKRNNSKHVSNIISIECERSGRLLTGKASH